MIKDFSFFPRKLRYWDIEKYFFVLRNFPAEIEIQGDERWHNNQSLGKFSSVIEDLRKEYNVHFDGSYNQFCVCRRFFDEDRIDADYAKSYFNQFLHCLFSPVKDLENVISDIDSRVFERTLFEDVFVEAARQVLQYKNGLFENNSPVIISSLRECLLYHRNYGLKPMDYYMLINSVNKFISDSFDFKEKP